jgi:hypothetical protein
MAALAEVIKRHVLSGVSVSLRHQEYAEIFKGQIAERMDQAYFFLRHYGHIRNALADPTFDTPTLRVLLTAAPITMAAPHLRQRTAKYSRPGTRDTKGKRFRCFAKKIYSKNCTPHLEKTALANTVGLWHRILPPCNHIIALLISATRNSDLTFEVMRPLQSALEVLASALKVSK